MYSRSAARSSFSEAENLTGFSSLEDIAIFCILLLLRMKRFLPSLSSSIDAHPASIECNHLLSCLRSSIFQRTRPLWVLAM